MINLVDNGTHFATWFEMTGPLVMLATERGKGKGDNDRSKEVLDDETELDYGDDDDEDIGAESQDDQTQRICKMTNKVKEGERTKEALAAERSKKQRKSMETDGMRSLHHAEHGEHVTNEAKTPAYMRSPKHMGRMRKMVRRPHLN
mgnify:CR=1 FL=1